MGHAALILALAAPGWTAPEISSGETPASAATLTQGNLNLVTSVGQTVIGQASTGPVLLNIGQIPSFKNDSLPPRTFLTVNGSTSANFALPLGSSALIGFTSMDDGYSLNDGAGIGAELTQFSLDGSTPSLFATPFHVTTDGAHSFSYYSVDFFGNTEAAQNANLTIDAVAPLAEILSPLPDSQEVCAVVNGTVTVTGSASDTHLTEWRLELATGAYASSGYILLSSGTTDVQAQVLAQFNSSDRYGFQTLRLSATDSVGLRTVAQVILFVGVPEQQVVDIGIKFHPMDVAVSTVMGLPATWASDRDKDRVVKFNADGSTAAVLGQGGSADPGFRNPTGLALERDAFLYVADKSNHRIVKLSTSGVVVWEMGRKNKKGKGVPGVDPGEFAGPRGLFLNPQGSLLYVADAHNNRIQILNPQTGAFISQTVLTGAIPNGVASSANGTLYVTDQNNRVLRVSTNGAMMQIAGAGSGQGQVLNPIGIMVTAQGALYVSDHGNDRIQKWDSLGNLMLVFGERGQSSGQFRNPSGLALDPDERLYVADTNNQRIQIFENPSAGPPPAAPQVLTTPVADGTFQLGEVYAFPNPARAGKRPTFHIEVGLADEVRIRVYDISGEPVHAVQIPGNAAQVRDDGQGPQYAYEYAWDVSGVPSGVYIYMVDATKDGQRIRKMSKVAVIK